MQTMTIAGTTLFAVAAQQLGDATQWYRIAALNGLVDPMVYGLVTIQLPPADASTSGGLPSS